MTAVTQTASDPLYISQLAYGHVSYRTDIRHPENVRYARNGDIRCAGCGLCAAYMMVRSMTDRDLRIELFRDLSYRAGANLDPGTDMLIYGRALAETFRLSMAVSDDERELIAALKSGAKAIINVGGDHDGYIGVFSDEGHFVFANSYDEGRDEIEILDPSFRADKYEGRGRSGKVRIEGMRCFASPGTIREDTANRSPAYYLFYSTN